MKSILQNLPRFSTVLVVLLIGWLLGRCFTPLDSPDGISASGESHSPADHADQTEVWTCSMHPSVMAPKPGDCPICGMDLIPVETGGGMDSGSRNSLLLDEGQKALAGIRTSSVRRAKASHEVRLVGKLDMDETAIATLSAYVGGRLDRLYVDYTGLKVRAGDHMAEIYSPQLFHAQEELIVAVESARRFANQSDESLQKISHSTVVAARKKLALYGLTEEQMQEIVDLGEPSEQITLSAPMGGTVIHRNAVEGQYVKEGDPLYTIADLNQLWLELDAYESDLPWLRYGQEVHFEVDAWPGQTFHGTISFLDPVLDPITRTVHVRVEVDNRDGRLRPEMYARAKVSTPVMGSGGAAPVDLNGKWMCPMHPEVLADQVEDCSICGMPLETAESLGFLEEGTDHELPLLIPGSAPLLTGDRAIVFVEMPDAEQHGASIFEARDVILGPRAGGSFVVLEGLEEGESVVTRGAFTIDSELQLRGKTSMMSPQEEEEVVEMEASSFEFQEQVGLMLTQMALMGEALASEPHPAGIAHQIALREIARLQQIINELERTVVVPDSAAPLIKEIRNACSRATSSSRIEEIRARSEPLQMKMIALAERFGYAGTERPFAVFHCPMALEDGADWIDYTGDGVRNPYYGASMLKCGSETRVIRGHTER